MKQLRFHKLGDPDFEIIILTERSEHIPVRIKKGDNPANYSATSVTDLKVIFIEKLK